MISQPTVVMAPHGTRPEADARRSLTGRRSPPYPPRVSAAPSPIDFLDVGFYVRDPYDAYAWLRHEAPVYWDAPNDLWAITRHEDVAFVSTHPEIFCSGEGYRPGMG